jgi:hypothetical protein
MNSRRRIRHPSCRIVVTLSRAGLHEKGPLPLPGEGGAMRQSAAGVGGARSPERRAQPLGRS